MKIPGIVLLFFSLLLFSSKSYSQLSFLFLKKKGKKVRTWVEGSSIWPQLKNGDILQGRILLLRNDTVYMDDIAFHIKEVKRLLVRKRIKRPFPINAEQAALITGGVALTTFGLKAAGWEKNTGKALLYASVIGYGPIALTSLFQQVDLRRKEYRLGKKFYLQMLDLRVVPHSSAPSEKKAF